MKGVNTIIWDWNGTLLNDVDICIDVINELLVSRNHMPLNRDRYREIFTFPVRDYYTKAGFDFSNEPFDKIAIEFIELYHKKLVKADIFQEVIAVLEAFKRNNFRQFLVSAMEHDSLVKSVKDKGIYDFFDNISGIHNHFAESKVDMAKKFVKELTIHKYQCCLIGDTIHDYEVANELGIRCLQVANGHQSFERLNTTGCRVVTDLGETLPYFKINHFDLNQPNL
jgi:phosphoglycolate phosphatase